MSDKVAGRSDDSDDKAPAGWGKPPVEGTKDAPADKPKRTRSSAKGKAADDAGPTVEEVTKDDVTVVTGRRGNADVAFNPATGFANVTLELRMPMDELAPVLAAMAAALKNGGAPF